MLRAVKLALARSGQAGSEKASLQNLAQIDNKSIQKSIKKLMMHLGIVCWIDYGGFGKGKWKHVGTKIE